MNGKADCMVFCINYHTSTGDCGICSMLFILFIEEAKRILIQ